MAGGPQGAEQDTPVLFFPSVNAQPYPRSRELPGEAMSFSLELLSQGW